MPILAIQFQCCIWVLFQCNEGLTLGMSTHRSFLQILVERGLVPIPGWPDSLKKICTWRQRLSFVFSLLVWIIRHDMNQPISRHNFPTAITHRISRCLSSPFLPTIHSSASMRLTFLTNVSSLYRYWDNTSGEIFLYLPVFRPRIGWKRQYYRPEKKKIFC